MIDYLVTATNQVLQQLRGATPQEIETLTAERQVIERELSNLVEFVIKGVLSSSQTLRKLVARDSVGARREIQKHIDDLRIAPAPDVGERVVRLTGRVKIDGLLGGEEAVRLQLVAGAGFEPATLGL